MGCGSPRHDALVDLILLADIDEHCPLREPARRFPRVDLAHAGALLLQDFLICRHEMLPAVMFLSSWSSLVGMACWRNPTRTDHAMSACGRQECE